MKKKILIVGAGRLGKGFLGEVFEAAEWHVAFLDHDPQIVKELREHFYQVKLYGTEGNVLRQVKNYSIYGCDAEKSCTSEVMTTDLIALCIYPENMKEAAEYLGPMISKRAKSEGKPLSVICCTNKNHIIQEIQNMFEASVDEEDRPWFRKNVAIRDVIIRRSTDYVGTDRLNLVSTATMSLLIQPPLFVDLKDVEWMELKDRLETLKEIKLYTYNSPHATCAYAGYQKGYKTINEAERDPEIAKLMQEVLEEAVYGVSREFDIEEKEVWDFCTMPKTKEEMTDTIFRVALDPVRKLARNDRLTGNAVFCLKHGLDPKALIQSIANGMAYDEPKDEKAMEIQALIEKNGITEATSKVLGLPVEDAIVIRVADIYTKMKTKG